MKDIKKLSCIVVLQVCDFGYLLFIITVPMVIFTLGVVCGVVWDQLLAVGVCSGGIIYCSTSAFLVQHGFMDGIVRIVHPELEEADC